MVTLLALPVVSWFRVGKSRTPARLGLPLSPFLRMPGPRPARETPLRRPTRVAPWVPVTSPERLPEKLVAEVAVATEPVVGARVCQPAPVAS